MILLDEVAETLDHAGIPFALIGAAALAVHGVVRSTFAFGFGGQVGGPP